MRPLMGVIACRIVPELREDLAGERVPVSVEERVPFCLRERRQVRYVVRVVLHQLFVVEDRRRDINPGLCLIFNASVRCLYADHLHDRFSRFSCRHEAAFHPAVAYAARVRGRPDIDLRTRSIRSVTGLQILVLRACEVRKLVETDEVIRKTLVLILVVL